MKLVQPFIKLDTPAYKNVPDKSETQGFERYMEERVKLKESLGGWHIGQNYFPRKDPDDLAQVFEEALERSCAKRTKLVARSTVGRVVSPTGKLLEEGYVQIETGDDAAKEMESDICRELGAVIRDHLKRTNGNIGHFPYSGERVIKRFADDESNETYCVHLDPFSIYWADAILYAVEETAATNTSRKTADNKKKPRDRTRKRKITFLVSTLVFMITALITYVENRFSPSTDPVFLSLVTNLLSVSSLVSLVSLILLLKDAFSKRAKTTDDDFFRDRDGFTTHFAKVGFGVNAKYETYDKGRFTREVKELHEYFSFLQLWSENTGRELPPQIRLKIIDFYRAVEPFIIDGKQRKN